MWYRKSSQSGPRSWPHLHEGWRQGEAGYQREAELREGRRGEKGGREGVQYSTVQYSALQYSIVQYSVVQCSTVQCITIQYSTVQCSAVQYSTVHYNTVQYSTVQWYLHV